MEIWIRGRTLFVRLWKFAWRFHLSMCSVDFELIGIISLPVLLVILVALVRDGRRRAG
jgi:hypothetical protein